MTPVGQYAHEKVRDSVPVTAEEQERADRRRRESEDVRVKERQEDHEGPPNKIGGGIAEPIGNLFPNREAVLVGFHGIPVGWSSAGI
jgi:hypothetical protein